MLPAGVEPAAAAAAGPASTDLPETAERVVDPSPEVMDGKHKLSRRWTIIHGAPNPSNPKDWKKTMTDIVTVGTAEDLVAALAAMETPSSLIGRVEGHQLFVFQDGARPDWKDPLVKSKGGRWDLPLRFTVRKLCSCFNYGALRALRPRGWRATAPSHTCRACVACFLGVRRSRNPRTPWPARRSRTSSR